LTLLARTVYAKQGFVNPALTVGRPSICLFFLSVRPFHHSPAAAAGLLLSAAPTGDIDQQRQPPGARQQMRAESPLQQLLT